MNRIKTNNSQRNPSTKLIRKLMLGVESMKINKITGESQPGYLKGYVEIRNLGHPLQPVISHTRKSIDQISKLSSDIISP